MNNKKYKSIFLEALVNGKLREIPLTYEGSCGCTGSCGSCRCGGSCGCSVGCAYSSETHPNILQEYLELYNKI
jgi:hypothetical protein